MIVTILFFFNKNKDFISNRFSGMSTTAKSGCSKQFPFKSALMYKLDIILPTKVYLVKAIVFPVVMYGCESWTIKKAEC